MESSERRFYGHLSLTRKRVTRSIDPSDRRGVPESGRIVRLLVGQGQGYIRLANGREVFFHRSDVQVGTKFNELAVGDTVAFELLNDFVSGARAMRLRR